MSKIENLSGRTVMVTATRFKNYGGRKVNQNEVFNLEGLRNDENLFRYNYVKTYEGDEVLDCPACERHFANQFGVDHHIRTEHGGRRDRDALEEESPPEPNEEQLLGPPVRGSQLRILL